MGFNFKACYQTFPSYEGEKINLRALKTEDAADLYAYYNNEMVYRYLDWYGPRDVSEAQEAIKRWQNGYEYGYIMRFAITDKKTDKIIGTIFITDPTETKGEIGYELAENYWGQGLMSEALQEVIRMGFEDLHLIRLQAIVCEENSASKALLKKFHFTKEGILRKYETHAITKVCKDMEMYSLLSDEYEKGKKDK